MGGTLIITAISLPVLLLRQKKSIKDWVLAYLFNGMTNGVIDNVLASYKILEYPVRFFPKYFTLNALFDFLVYPTFTVFFNQWTVKDKPKMILIKYVSILTEYEKEIRNKEIENVVGLDFAMNGLFVDSETVRKPITRVSIGKCLRN